MSHEVETMAYRHEVPWHGLGNALTEGQPIQVWMREAGFNFEVKQATVQFFPLTGDLASFVDQKVLYRSDNLRPLSVVTDRYKVVQPKEVLEFYRDLVAVGGFKLETAGVLKQGRKVWALARTGIESQIAGKDRLKAYLLLCTSYDGSLATTAQFTSVRVVCNNTLQMAVGDTRGAIRVPHTASFDAQAMKQQLGIGVSSWATFMDQIRTMASRKVRPVTAKRFLVNVLGDPTLALDQQPSEKTMAKVLDLFNGKAIGSEMPSAEGTAWGLVNAVTEWVDHHARSRASDSRLHSAWFGAGSSLKKRAFEEALKLAA